MADVNDLHLITFDSPVDQVRVTAHAQHSDSSFAHSPTRAGMLAHKLKRPMNCPLDVLRARRASFSDVIEDGGKIASRP